jgi:hypothetical protein
MCVCVCVSVYFYLLLVQISKETHFRQNLEKRLLFSSRLSYQRSAWNNSEFSGLTSMSKYLRIFRITAKKCQVSIII